MISFDDALKLSLLHMSEQFILHAAACRPRLEVATADVLYAFQTASEVLDEFELVLEVPVFASLQAGDVVTEFGRRG